MCDGILMGVAMTGHHRHCTSAAVRGWTKDWLWNAANGMMNGVNN